MTIYSIIIIPNCGHFIIWCMFFMKFIVLLIVLAVTILPLNDYTEVSTSTNRQLHFNSVQRSVSICKQLYTLPSTPPSTPPNALPSMPPSTPPNTLLNTPPHHTRRYKCRYSIYMYKYINCFTILLFSLQSHFV